MSRNNNDTKNDTSKTVLFQITVSKETADYLSELLAILVFCFIILFGVSLIRICERYGTQEITKYIFGLQIYSKKQGELEVNTLIFITSIGFTCLFALTFFDILMILSLVQLRRLDTSAIVCIGLITVVDSSLWCLWFYINSHIN